MIGILNEKPSQARNFAKALGGKRGTFNGEQYVIVAQRGHLYEYKRPNEQVPKEKEEHYRTWSLDNLPWDANDFSWEYEERGDVRDLLDLIKNSLSSCDEIAIATDIDPTGEGELLAWETISELGLQNKKITRLYFLDESEKSIREAFVNRKPLPPMVDDPDWKMAAFRARWDMLSMQWSRVATICGDGQSVLRQGRLKSCMTLLVGQQLEAYENYKRVPYFYPAFEDDHGVKYIDPEADRFDKEADAKAIVDGLHASDVVVDSTIRKKTAPRRLIDLAGLSSALSGKGIKAKTVLETYQKMYVDGVVSYPRTEDKTITPEQFNELLPKVDQIARLVGVDPGLLTMRKPRKTHVKPKGAHGANRPGPNVPSVLDDLKKYGAGAVEIYDIVARSYLAMLAPDYEYDQQKGHVKDFPAYVGSANVPVFVGWKAVFGDLEVADDDEVKSGLGSHADPKVVTGYPKRPQKPTMSWLMKQLEKYDVGTGATRTSTYAEVTNAVAKFPLLSEHKGTLKLTKFGDMSYRLLPGTHIGDLKLTERVQDQMRRVAAGEVSADDCLAEVASLVSEDIDVMQKNGKAMRDALGIRSVSNEKFTGVWNGEEVSVPREFGGHRFTDDEVKRLLAGETITFDAKSKAGKVYVACGALGHIEWKGRTYVRFQFDPIPGSIAGHIITSVERKILKEGGTVSVTDCVSKKGRKFACDLQVGEDGKLQFVFPRVPTAWGGYKFKQAERDKLEAGLVLDMTDSKPFKGKSGKNFGCKIRLGKRGDGREGIIADFMDEWVD